RVTPMLALASTCARTSCCNAARSIPPLPLKSSATPSMKLRASRCSRAACICDSCSRSRCSGGVRAQAMASTATAIATTAANRPRLHPVVIGCPPASFAFPIRNGMLASTRPHRDDAATTPWRCAMSTDRPWLQSYPQGVPATIDPDEYRSVAAVFAASASRHAQRPAYRNFGKTLTYAQVDALSTQFAAYLLGELGLKKGDRVALMMPNCLQYPIAIFGALRAGLTVVNVNPLYTARELKHQLVDSGAAAIVVVDNFGRTVQEVLPHTPLRQVITTGLGDMLGFPKGPIVNFVLRYVKK